MRIQLCILASALLAPSATAQTIQYYELWSQTSFTSRGSINLQAGETLQGFHSSHFRGLAGNGGGAAPASCTIVSLQATLQDQNCGTVEKFDWVIRRGDDLNGPTAGSAGLYGGVLGLTSPPGANVICAWVATSVLSTPVKVDHDKFFAIGHAFPTSPSWVSDGLSTHTSFGSQAFPHQSAWTEDITRVPTTPQSRVESNWRFVGTITVADHASDYRTWRYRFGTNGAILELGNGGRYGTGGMFPLPSTSSAALAYTVRVTGGSGSSGKSPVVVLAALGYLANPVAIPGSSGADLYCALGVDLYFTGPAANTIGQSIVPIAPFVPASLANLGNFPFQAAIDNGTSFKLTNAQSIDP